MKAQKKVKNKGRRLFRGEKQELLHGIALSGERVELITNEEWAQAWQDHRDELMAEYAKEKRWNRPKGWWWFEKGLCNPPGGWAMEMVALKVMGELTDEELAVLEKYRREAMPAPRAELDEAEERFTRVWEQGKWPKFDMGECPHCAWEQLKEPEEMVMNW